MALLRSALAAALLASSSLAFGPVSPKDAPPAIPATKLENFTWTDPFASADISKFTARCEAQKTFRTREYQLHDLREKPPAGLGPYAEALRTFFTGRPYPGGWEGLDAHRYERNLLVMEYTDVPVKVREWIEEQERAEGEGKGLFAVYEKPASDDEDVKGPVEFPDDAEEAAEWRGKLDKQRVAVFAPGAVYENLPLWVAEGSGCEATLLDLEKYSSKLTDGGVVAWPTSHKSPKRYKGRRDAEFTVKAQALRAEEAKGEQANKDEL